MKLPEHEYGTIKSAIFKAFEQMGEIKSDHDMSLMELHIKEAILRAISRTDANIYTIWKDLTGRELS